jgi:hypothetical protein
MMLWLLAFIVLASLAGIGYRQGVIRVAFSLVGIIFGALLAGPLGKLVKPLLVVLGLKTPPLAWLLAPVVVFIVFSIIFKIAGLMVHQKVDVHFKYHAGDLRLVLWERLSRRTGLCLALVNGAAYLMLAAAVIYPLSYWTVQTASPDQNPRLVRLLNSLGRDLDSTGFVKVARALDPMPKVWYATADLVGVLYNTPLLQARLSRYPAFLGLAERPEFQDLGSDAQFTEMWQRREPIMHLVDYPKVQAILHNPDLLKLIWATVVPDLSDLNTFLDTGKSPKYDPEKILGRWDFNVNVTLSLFRQGKPNIYSSEMQKWKKWMIATFTRTSLVAMTDHHAVLKNIPQLPLLGGGAGSGSGSQTLTGDWKGQDGKYLLAVSSGGKEDHIPATIQHDRLTLGTPGLTLVFERED